VRRLAYLADALATAVILVGCAAFLVYWWFW
jgi:hypothetical protein